MNEMVKASEVLPNHEDVRQELDRLEQVGDSQALNEVARRAQAYQEYEARAGASERAGHFARIKVMAEARIGSIDLDLHPTRGSSALEFNGWEVPRAIRAKWRLLGAGLQGGQLDKAMKLVEEDSDVVSTHAVSRELREWGALWVETRPLLRRFHHLYAAEGLRVADLERQVGVKGLGHYFTRPGNNKPAHDKMRRHLALKVAPLVGVDPQTLKPVRSTKAPHAKRRRLRKARRLPGGRLDTAYTLIRQALQELDRVTGEGGGWATEDAWQHLYEAEDIVGRALRRAV